jgi:hypothetical protein
VTEILSQGVDFLLFPGDLVSGYASIGPTGFEAQLREWVRIMEPVYNAGIGVYVSRGNHEIMDVWGYYIRPDIDPKDNHATRWLNVFGNDLYPEQKLPDNGPAFEKYMTYAVTHKNAFIVSLDQYAGINTHRPQGQSEWLASNWPLTYRTYLSPATAAFGGIPIAGQHARRRVRSGIRNAAADSISHAATIMTTLRSMR